VSGSQKKTSESKSAEKQHQPDPKQAAEQTPLLEGLGLAGKGLAPGDLPDAPNSRALRQAAILQMQRTQGNRAVQRYLIQRTANGSLPGPARKTSPVIGYQLPARPQIKTMAPAEAFAESPLAIESAPVGQDPVQREPSGNVEVGSGGIKVELSMGAKKEFTAKYAKITLEPGAAIMGELKPKKEAAAGVSANKEGGKVSVNVYKEEAKAAGSRKFSEMAYKELGEGADWAIDKVDWETELTAGEEEGYGKANIATGVKFTFKNGHEAVVKATLFERSAKSGLDGPNLSVTPTFKFPEATLWENKDAKLTLGGEVKMAMKLSPNWKQIFLELAEKGGKAMARQFARAALTGMVDFMLGAGGFISGGAGVLAAAYLSMESNDAIENARHAAEKAADGYVHGFCIGWGIEEFGNSGAENFFYKGLDDAKDKLQAMIVKIQNHPVFAPWKFTQDELRIALKEKLKTRGGEVYKQVDSENRKSIYREMVIQFYHKRKALWYVPEYSAWKEAKWMGNGLGLDVPSFIPKPE
jgi:hypothetical protein